MFEHEYLTGREQDIPALFNEIAEVLRLGILARRGEDTAMAYVRAFIDVVNAHVPVAVQQPIADRPWR